MKGSVGGGGGRSSHHPRPSEPAHADDWANGSWTVDCSCGVTFDDGEEMVSCDECGVWVHTRCARYVRGDPSFACHNCKLAARLREEGGGDQQHLQQNQEEEQEDEEEETEVAQLLAELPTKTASCMGTGPNRPLLYAEIPLEERVHVQGLPGGDPALFEGLSSVFTSQLWKCTGYVPKKFNFQYREFPCWDEDDKGADMLFNLSKEGMGIDREGVILDGRLLSIGGGGGGGKRERSRSRGLSGMQCSKRRKEDSRGDKGFGSERKKARMESAKSIDENNMTASAAYIRVKSCEVWKDVDLNAREADIAAPDGGILQREETPSEPSCAYLKEENKSNTEPQHDVNDINNVGQSSGDNLKQGALTKISDDVDGNHAASVKSELSPSTCELPCEELNEDAKESTLEKVSCRDLHTSKKSKEERNVEVDSLTGIDTVAVSSESSKPANLDLIRNMDVSTTVSVLDLNNMTLKNAHSDKINGKTVGSNDQLTGTPNLPNSLATGRNLHSANSTKLEETGVKFSGSIQDKEITEPSEAIRESRANSQDLIDETSSRINGSKKQEEETSSLQKVSPKRGFKGSAFQDNKNSKVSSSSAPAISRSIPSSQSPETAIAVSKAPINFIKHPRVKLSSSAAAKLESEANVTPSEESMGEDHKYHSKGNLRAHSSSGSRSSHTGRVSYSSSTKNMVTGAKEAIPLPPSRFFTKDESSASLGSSGTTGPTQSASSSLKLVSSTVSHKSEKIHQQVPFASSDETNNSKLLHPQASSNPVAGLSDEELALLLHQELNSSPRVPRVPRVRQAVGMPLPATGSMNVFSKRPSLPVGKDHVSVFRRKSKDDVSRDRTRDSQRHDSSDDMRRKDRASPSPDRKYKESSADGYVKKDAFIRLSDTSVSMKTATSFQAESVESGVSSFDASVQSALPRNTIREIQKDDSSSSSRTLPGLIGEIMSKNRHTSFDELCAAVRPHWNDLRKPNGERYAYTSHLHAVQDCLRNRDEWSHLIDQGPKTTSSKKRRKVEPDVPKHELENEKVITGAAKDTEETSVESHKDVPKGKRNNRKRRRLELKGRDVAADRKIRDKRTNLDKDNATSSPLSNDENGTQFSEDDDDDNNDDEDEDDENSL